MTNKLAAGATLAVGSASAAPGTAGTGWLKIGEMPDGRPMEIPVIVVNGARPGPTLWIQACIHGDEYCGCFIAQDFANGLDPADMTGAVVTLPTLNGTAFNAGRRTSPFDITGGWDLNRCFPGVRDGAPTEQMAHAIFQEILRVADAMIDFHTGGTKETRWLLYANVEGEVGQRSEAMARAFGFEVILPTPPTTLTGSAFINAAKRGIPGIIVESGGYGPAFDRHLVEEGAAKLADVARQLGILPGAAPKNGPFTYLGDFAWINAPRGGLYRPVLRGGERVKQGEPIGRFYDLYGDLIEEVKAPASGIVLTAHPGPALPAGETLIQIGTSPREA